MTLTTERQQFEEWFKFHSEEECTDLLQRNSAGTNYLHPHTDLAWIAWKASRELLANREAQSAGFYTTVSGRKGVIWHNAAPEDDTAIYTAPPAPAVPTKKAPKDFLFRTNANYQATVYVAEGWNACRAAMLNHVGDTNEKAESKCECSSIDYCGDSLRGMMAQPVSGGYKLPESWIACSEQPPIADGAYWCWFGKEKPSVIQQRVCIWNDRNHEWCDSAVTHWMPLPAAPEGGNDLDTRR
ncbi:DUF551 domain-containing protein [Serratia sp. IR-2025]